MTEEITCVCGKIMTPQNSKLAPELFLCDECAKPVDAMQGWASAITDLQSAAEICRNVEKQRDALRAEVEKQQKQIQTLRVALQTLVDQGEPERGDGELWSSWQVKVKARLAAIETLAQPEGGKQ